MTDTPDVTDYMPGEDRDGAQSPFFSLRYHFGMLLGVSDFETEQAYHRGKMRLHNQWLHRDGVVWGFDVKVDLEKGEIRVLPGLALDPLGRELRLDGDACVNVAAWFEAHRNDAGIEAAGLAESPPGTFTFDAHVVIRHKTCLSRQVPALSELCENAGTATAYSRVFETVEIFLRPGPAPKRTPPYHRLRLLFGLDEPVRDAAGAIVPGDQAVLKATEDIASFRKFAALDEIDLKRPEGDEFPVTLANIGGIKLAKDGEKWKLAAGTADVAVRPSHVATSTIQELLCGSPGTARGPAVLRDSVKIDETYHKLTFQTNADLAPSSVADEQFSLAYFDEASGWQTINISDAKLDGPKRTVTVTFAGSLGGQLIRFIAKGSGQTPLLGVDLLPLNHGRDFVYNQKRP